jgi:hypothetical protein
MELPDEKLRHQAFVSYTAHAMWANAYSLTKKISQKMKANTF